MTTDTHTTALRAEATLPRPEVPQPAAFPPKKPRGPSVGRIVAGAVVGLAAGAVALGGGAVLVVDGEKGDDGYFMSDAYTYTAAPGTAAITTDNLDMDLDGAEWLVDSNDLGDVKLKVTRSDDGKPVFAGIAKTKDVDRYLSGVATTTVTDIEFDPFEPTYEQTTGKTKASDPADQSFVVHPESPSVKVISPIRASQKLGKPVASR